MTRLEKILFQLTIFLIPTNLSLKWILPESYVNGILVDYLIPKLYLSDLPILTLLILWLSNHLRSLSRNQEVRPLDARTTVTKAQDTIFQPKVDGAKNFFEISWTRLLAWLESLDTTTSQLKSFEVEKKLIGVVNPPQKNSITGADEQPTSFETKKVLVFAVLALLLALILTSLSSPAPISSLWFWLKLLEFSLFFLWIRHHLTVSFPSNNHLDSDEANNFFEIFRFRMSNKTQDTIFRRFLRPGNSPAGMSKSALFQVKSLENQKNSISGADGQSKSPAIEKKFILEAITTPLLLALLFQSSLALYQFTTQHSLIGYPLLGESTLTNTANIAKQTVWPFEGIRILPYGTTPHPNVLAGFLTIGLLFLFTITKSKRTDKANNFFEISWTRLSAWLASRFTTKPQTKSSEIEKKFIGAVSVLALLALYLTQSLTAWLALAIGLTFLYIPRKYFFHAFLSGLLLFFVVLSLNTPYPLLNTDSIARRQQLNRYALQMFLDHPVTGVGINQFTARLPQYGTITAFTSFLQPVHNIFLLWLAETGLVGLLLIGFALKKLKIGNWPLTIPLILIGLADHYLLTLQTGQILLTITLGLSSRAKFVQAEIHR